MSKILDDNRIVSDGEFTHFANLKTAAATRVAAEGSATTQKALDAAAAAYCRTVLTSAKVNNATAGYEPTWTLLRSLTGGV